MSGPVDVHRFSTFGGARCEVMAAGAHLDEVSACVAEVYAFEARLSRFRPESELSALNAAAGARVAVSPLLGEMLRVALDAFALSDGLVDAAVLPAVVAAGYDRSIEQVRARDVNRTTGLDAVAAAGAVPALPDVLEVGDGWARLRAGCGVDLGGVGKGWLADRLCERLGDAAVNLGGDVRAFGEGPDGAGWAVGLCDGTTVCVRDAGVATSGVGGRRWRGGHHLVDPRTGRPAASDVTAATVVAADALGAEVLAKCVVLLGAERGPAFVTARGAARVHTVPGAGALLTPGGALPVTPGGAVSVPGGRPPVAAAAPPPWVAGGRRDAA